ncbi:MAG: PDZ domain-containing protein [Xanthomonadales bacterium]|nr:PDZ domain-containing protein [Xanthomonadales bacterium]
MVRACVILLLVLACAACARVSVYQPPAGPGESMPGEPAVKYEAEPGRDAASVARLRAQAPPATPMLAEGGDPLADRNRLAAQGLTRIGGLRFHAADADEARQLALAGAREVGAEEVLLYAPRNGDGEWLAACFVRFQLLFGATFRDLGSDEHERIGTRGGVVIGKVIAATPAARANLLPGDVVLVLNGEPVAGRAAFGALLRQHAGRDVTLVILRNDESLHRVVRLGALPPER